MTMNEVREYGGVLGILSLNKYKKRKDLIRTIQLVQGGNDCFQRLVDCKQANCLWKMECFLVETESLEGE